MTTKGQPPARHTTARQVAARVLFRVHKDGAFAAASLDAELIRAALPSRDAALATELCYGVLRSQGYLRQRLLAHANTGKLIDHQEALSHLLIGAYSILLSRIPAHAAVSEAVEAIKGLAGVGPSKFANAILRGLLRESEKLPAPDPATVAWESTPPWLRDALCRALGEEEARRYLAAGPIPAPTGVVVFDSESRDEVADTLAEYGLPSRPSRYSKHALLLDKGARIREVPGFERDFMVQEEGAHLVALGLGTQPGERVLDACAGRGNKSLLLSLQCGPNGSVVATDKYPKKLQTLMARSTAAVRVAAVDWTVGPGDVLPGFDRILVDAPCSGSGTLRRRPDILENRADDSLTGLAEIQLAIVRGSLAVAREGTYLLYCVCSVLKEEGEQITEQLLAEGAFGWRLLPAPFASEPLRGLAGEAHTLRLLPHVHQTDGYYLASFVVTR